MEAVQTQLLYLRHVLEIKASDAALYQKTSKGKIFTLEEKVIHLKVLIKENEHVIIGNQQTSTSQRKKLLTSDERQSRFESEKLKVFEKVNHGRMQQKMKRSKEEFDMLCSDPSKLIGRRFQHKIQESADDFAAWYAGTVKGIDSNGQNPIKTMFDLTYDQDGDDEIFTFPLLAHLKKEDVILN